ncbi:MAG: hypothetical protein ACE37F_13835 [Nannocystaceae bacterium]|nr:hypothetical protein [bacterium]
MRNEDQQRSLSLQVERAANEGMVDVATPSVPTARGDVEETKLTARRLLELQLVAQRAYEATLRSLKNDDDAETVSVVAERLEQDIDAIRIQLARLHDRHRVKPPKGAAAVEKATGIAAGMLGKAATAKGLMIGELAMAHTAEALIERADLIPDVAEALRTASVDAAKARAATLRLVA